MRKQGLKKSHKPQPPKDLFITLRLSDQHNNVAFRRLVRMEFNVAAYHQHSLKYSLPRPPPIIQFQEAHTLYLPGSKNDALVQEIEMEKDTLAECCPKAASALYDCSNKT